MGRSRCDALSRLGCFCTLWWLGELQSGQDERRGDWRYWSGNFVHKRIRGTCWANRHHRSWWACDRLQRRGVDKRWRDFGLWLFADQCLSRTGTGPRGFEHQIGKMKVIAVGRIGEPSTPAFALDLSFQIGSNPESSRSDLVSSGRSLLLRCHGAEQVLQPQY